MILVCGLGQRVAGEGKWGYVRRCVVVDIVRGGGEGGQVNSGMGGGGGGWGWVDQ